MAERRMFTRAITEDDHFMSLSSSAQALYLHLTMGADDDGFCNQVNTAMFRAHASVQDLEALLEKKYVYEFENGVVVIKHWRMANSLRKDRYTPTNFKEELAKLKLDENGAYTWLTNGCQVVAERLPQVRLGKVSIGKVSKDISAPSYDNSNAVGKLATNKTDEYYYLHQEDIDKYKEYYPAVDVEQEIKNMSAWLDANPKNRKTHNGMPRFINGWLSREQNRTRAYSEKPKEKKGIDFFYE